MLLENPLSHDHATRAFHHPPKQCSEFLLKEPGLCVVVQPEQNFGVGSMALRRLENWDRESGVLNIYPASKHDSVIIT